MVLPLCGGSSLQWTQQLVSASGETGLREQGLTGGMEVALIAARRRKERDPELVDGVFERDLSC